MRAGIAIDAYQMEPLRKALRLPRVNIFIADDTGLGKTIEAGLIACGLMLRRKAKVIVAAARAAVDRVIRFLLRDGMPLVLAGHSAGGISLSWVRSPTGEAIFTAGRCAS